MPLAPAGGSQPTPLVIVSVDEDLENQMLIEIANEFNEEIYAEIDDAYPGFVVSPAVQLQPRERLQRYLLRIYEAYPMDPYARLVELNWLLNTDYVDLMKQGLAPPPMSRPWVQLMRVPKIMEKMLRDFRTCYRDYFSDSHNLMLMQGPAEQMPVERSPMQSPPLDGLG